MIPVEVLWFTLFFMFGLIGASRGLRKELGATTILLLSLFAAFIGQQQILSRITGALPTGPLGDWPEGTVAAIYYAVIITFVAFISYEGIVLAFPVKELRGVGKGIFGFFGGLINGYLIIGTLWNVIAQADYFRPKLALVSGTLSALHDGIIPLLPISLMDNFSPYIMLVLGMILLLAIVLK
ncbi:MAG: hypothetical protein P8129_04650 [Anaerolineae bacterium]|jgi:hypothetical protein